MRNHTSDAMGIRISDMFIESGLSKMDFMSKCDLTKSPMSETHSKEKYFSCYVVDEEGFHMECYSWGDSPEFYCKY